MSHLTDYSRALSMNISCIAFGVSQVGDRIAYWNWIYCT